VLHVAGGYKATLPLLCALGEYISAWHVRHGLPPVEVCCRHEDSLEAIRIPLRQANLGADCGALRAFRAPQAAEHEADPLWGFAYDEKGFTPLGEALRCLCHLLAPLPHA